MTTNWLSDYVTANDIRIYYHRTGGDKPPVVLAHGITDNGLCWTRLALALEADYDLIMFDARGHGLSDAPESGYGLEDHAADLAALVQALGLERPALIGHSMGAANVAVAVALYPDLARCAILEDPPWRDEPASVEERTAMAEEWRAQTIDRQSKTREEVIAEGRAQNPTWADVEWGPWANAKLQVSPNVFDFITGTLPPSWQEVARRITCPLLLITGDPELGAIVTPQVAQEVLQIRPDAEVVHIAGAGHSVRREQFERYVEAVRAFLSADPKGL